MTLNLEELETLLAAATPGPWAYDEACITHKDGDELLESYSDLHPREDLANRKLIAALRNAAPALIARIREQEDIMEQAKGVFIEIDDVTDKLEEAEKANTEMSNGLERLGKVMPYAGRVDDLIDATIARVRELEEALSHMAHQHHCGCKHPACRRCWDDETNFKLINEPQPEKS